MYQLYLWLSIILILAVVIIELWKPEIINEGFSNLVSVGDSLFWAKWVPRRGDVGPNPTDEENGYIRDTRYFSGYVDVQRLGATQDFCRMVSEDDDPDNTFFCCALGGTEGLSTVKYRTPSTKDGFELSRDDYMNDVLKEGRQGYCRILKTGPNTFEAKCNPAQDLKFGSQLITDSNPPKEIQTLLNFYEGITFWLRFKDDMLDYAKNLETSISGGMEIEEYPPLRQNITEDSVSEKTGITKGLEFNGIDQFLRIGDTTDLSFGDKIELRYLRAVSFWVYFEEFTNNAHIFDFGNGPGNDNVFVGIVGRGNPGKQTNELSEEQCIDESLNTVPTAPSGAQCTQEVSPQTLMETTSANINQWDCPKPELFGRIMKPIQPVAAPEGDALTADLLYEVWDSKQRKQHIQVKNVFKLRTWTHVVITAKNMDAFRPDIEIFIDGKSVYTQPAGWLPQTNYTTNNYIGKSNWASVTSQYDNADELFKGKLFDFRGYKLPMNKKKVNETIKWGKTWLGLDKKIEW